MTAVMDAPAERPEAECPNGHGLMIYYASTQDDDVDDFLECPDCGHRKFLKGQRSG